MESLSSKFGSLFITFTDDLETGLGGGWVETGLTTDSKRAGSGAGISSPTSPTGFLIEFDITIDFLIVD